MPKKTAQDMKDLAEWMATHPHGDGNSSNGAHPEGSAGERPLELTDTGNANRLFQGYGEDFRWVPKLRQFIVWTGHAWELDVFNQVQEFAKKSANDLLLVAHGIQNVEVKDAVVKWSMGSRSADRIGSSIRLLKSIRPAQVDFKELDTHADKLAVLNGVYNLRTGALEPGKREDYLTQVVPIIARPGAPHPKWDEFLRLLFCTGAEDDADMLEYIRLVLGYWVTGSVLPLVWGWGQWQEHVPQGSVACARGDKRVRPPHPGRGDCAAARVCEHRTPQGGLSGAQGHLHGGGRAERPPVC